MEELKVGIYVPSYKRSNKIRTEKLFESCTYLVRESERQAYENAGVKNIWAVPDEEIDSGTKAYYYIINNAKDDVIVIADDDINDFQYLLDINVPLCKNVELITDEIYRLAQLVYDLDIGLGMLPPNCIPYYYTQEFAWFGIPGAVKFINKAKFCAKLDTKVEENFDIDMVMQELYKNRITLFCKYLYDIGEPMDKTAGGNSERVRNDQLASLTNMKLKWGKFFDYNEKSNKPKINVKR